MTGGFLSLFSQASFNLCNACGNIMASKNKTLVKMTSTATMPDGSLTGTYFVIRKNPKSKSGIDKIQRKKYDKRVKKHVLFVEKKMPSHSK